MAGKRHHSRLASAEMFRRIQVTKTANEEQRRAEEARRATDPLEQAKTFLRRKGYSVFAESVTDPKSSNIVVGKLSLSGPEVIAMAERIRGRVNA